MSARDDLARRAVTEALRLRGRHGRAADAPICPIDLAIDAGVDVRFESLKSLEGLYTPDGPLIVLGVLRPRGRRASTCAHELGHHVFGHGTRIEEVFDDGGGSRDDVDEEYIADRFAAGLLMPKLAVLRAFDVRGWPVAVSDPVHAFTIAGVFGVGYTTLVGYMERTLGAIGSATASSLRKWSPKEVRARIVGDDGDRGLVVVDDAWTGRPIDAEVGDNILIPIGSSVESTLVDQIDARMLRARAPGTTILFRRGDRQLPLRIMRAGYTGIAEYRHLEDADDDA